MKTILEILPSARYTFKFAINSRKLQNNYIWLSSLTIITWFLIGLYGVILIYILIVILHIHGIKSFLIKDYHKVIPLPTYQIDFEQLLYLPIFINGKYNLFKIFFCL